jgi:hypothetical protein
MPRPAPLQEFVLPNEITASTNLNGSISNIVDDPDSPDSNWLVNAGLNQNTSAYIGFNNPIRRLYNGPETGVDYQHFFKVLVRKNSTGGSAVAFSVTLHETSDSTAITTLISSQSLTDSDIGAGRVFTTPTWNTSLITNKLGTDVRIRILQTTGGSGGNRRWVEIGAVRWYVKVRYPEITSTV